MPNANRDKGLKAERDVANYFKINGWPDAKRLVATGWRTGDTEDPDRGDIRGVPFLCLQVKALSQPLTGKLLVDTWHATQQQTSAMMADTRRSARGIIIEKRKRSADVGRWWAHLSSVFYVEVLLGRPQPMFNAHLVRVELGDIITELRLWTDAQLNLESSLH